MKDIEKIEQRVSSWAEVSVHPHRFGGREFRFRAAEIGHVHNGGIVDIPFPCSIRDALLAERLAEEHHWAPNSGWITFCIRSEQDLDHAFWLMRLSYLRYALKTAADPYSLLKRESERLCLNPRFQSLLEMFIPKSAKQLSGEAIPA
jgi:hypothetical protein